MPRHVNSEPRRGTGWLVVLSVGLLTASTAVAAAAGIGPFSGSADTVDAAEPAPTQAAEPALVTPTPTPTPTPPPDAVFTILAAGDVLTHQAVNISARADGGYDFRPLFAPVQSFIAGADLALCHMEVPVAPPGSAPSGFPMFGAPEQIVPALAAAGWDGCSTASNHSVDRGAAGVVTTLDAFDAVGLGHVGTARTAQEAASAQVYTLEREGQTIRVAHIAATYGTNGLPVPADSPWMVQLIDTTALAEQAAAARAAGADVVVASVHCCVEYTDDPTAQQEQIAAELASSGVIDLLIGHHAHVPQPVAQVPGGPRGDGMWVAYGLGNFISNQGPHAGLAATTENGLMLLAHLRKPADGPVTVDGVEWTAITVDRGAGHRVESLSAAGAAGVGAGTLSADQVAARRALVAGVAGTAAPELVVPPTPSGPPPVVTPRTPPTP